jgi:hypothetical protein
MIMMVNNINMTISLVDGIMDEYNHSIAIIDELDLNVLRDASSPTIRDIRIFDSIGNC